MFKMKWPSDDSIIFDVIGLLIATLMAAAAGVAFWFLFCHPASHTEALVPILRPLRITVTCGLALACYQLLARNQPASTAASRRSEFITVLSITFILSTVRYFYGAPDASTVVGTELDQAVQWSQALGLGLPLTFFAILGYLRGNRRNHLPAQPRDQSASTSTPDQKTSVQRRDFGASRWLRARAGL